MSESSECVRYGVGNPSAIAAGGISSLLPPRARDQKARPVARSFQPVISALEAHVMHVGHPVTILSRLACLSQVPQSATSRKFQIQRPPRIQNTYRSDQNSNDGLVSDPSLVVSGRHMQS